LKIKGTGEYAKKQHRLRLGREKLVNARFGTQRMTRVGGAPLLLKIELAEQMVSGAAGCLTDRRLGWQTKRSLCQLLWQRVLLLCCGYEDAVDGQLLAHDPGLVLALGFSPVSQATMCRFENGLMTRANCYRLAVWLVWLYISNKKKAPKQIRLDFDGSCVPTRGQQQGSSYRKYYDTQMYFPLFVFDQDGVLITAILRQGEEAEATTTLPVLKRLVKAFRAAWAGVEILVVMDAGFNDPKIYNWCEDEGKPGRSGTVQYLVKLKNTRGGLRSYSNDLAKAAKVSFSKLHGPEKYVGTKMSKNQVLKEIRKKSKRERKEELFSFNARVVHNYGEFENQTGKGGKCKKQWRSPRRILSSCVHDDWGGRRSFWVTNIVGSTAEYLINEVYSKRGEAELGIRDMKAMRCDKLSCENFLANQSRLLFQVLAQRLLLRFREQLPHSMRSCALETIREQFICIPALVEDRARAEDLIWSGSFPFKNHMHALCQRLVQQAHATKDWLSLFIQFLKTLNAKKLSAG
jgi:hypothetical protein